MSRVMFIGKANSYTRGNYRWTKENSVITIPEPMWLQLKKERDQNGNRLFMIAEDEDDQEINRQDMDVINVGEFLTKKAAIEYARDMMGVQLEQNCTLELLNKQTVDLKRRFDIGRRGADLISDVYGAQLAEDVDMEDDVTVDRELDTALTRVQTSGSGASAAEQRQIAARQAGTRVAKPTSVPKPGKTGVRTVGASGG